MKRGKHIFFNNCRKRAHATKYKHISPDAFYDLDPVRHVGIAENLPRGKLCIVFQNEPDGIARFDWYSLLFEKPGLDDEGLRCRVFFGKHLKTEKLKKSRLKGHDLYGVVINKNRHFKRPSVIPPKAK